MEQKVSKDFAQLYIEGMHRVGYDEGDNAKQRFIAFYNECFIDGQYNIKEIFSLSKEQTDFIMNNIPSSLSGLAKGAILTSELGSSEG